MNRTLRFVIAVVLLTSAAASAQEPRPDPWAPVRFMAGTWEGTTSGKPGDGTVKRTYEFVLGNRYLHERNVSTYPPQERNPKGEVHEHWSFISHDRARKVLVLRQFHVEGFVNQFALDAELSAPPGKLVFASEGFENLASSWRARETYQVLGPDEFTETFELAAPGKPFEVYGVNRFKRVAR